MTETCTFCKRPVKKAYGLDMLSRVYCRRRTCRVVELYKRMRVKPVFAWYDIWIGAYWDRKAQALYLMIPFVGIRISFPEDEE